MTNEADALMGIASERAHLRLSTNGYAKNVDPHDGERNDNVQPVELVPQANGKARDEVGEQLGG